jgi:hypothetical protein
MAEEKVKLKAVAQEATMTAATRIQALEADVKIEAKYKGEPEFTVVSDTTMMKGEVKSQEGKWEQVPAGKELEQRRVTITPKNIAWYKSRTATKAMKAGPGDYIGDPGEQFKLEPTKKRTMQVRKDELDAAKESKLSKLKA